MLLVSRPVPFLTLILYTDCEIDCDEGAMLCGRFTECCSYYDDDMCVEECPDDRVADPDNFTCVVRTFYNSITNKLYFRTAMFFF